MRYRDGSSREAASTSASPRAAPAARAPPTSSTVATERGSRRSAIKGKAGVTADGDPKRRVAAFRTNGVGVCLTFVSGHVE
jgi:hypothetical protein